MFKDKSLPWARNIHNILVTTRILRLSAEVVIFNLHPFKNILRMEKEIPGSIILNKKEMK